jgi:hypothetical protein
MTINLTPAESPFTLTAERFTDIINLKPDVILLCSGSGTIVINLPPISSLQNQQGQVEVQMTDNLVGIQVNCTAPDKLSSIVEGITNTTSFAVGVGNENTALSFTTAAPRQIWVVL